MSARVVECDERLDEKDRVQIYTTLVGYCSLKMWANSKPNPTAGFHCTDDENAPTLSFEVDMVRPVPVFVEPSTQDFNKMAKAPIGIPTEPEMVLIEQVLKTDPLYHPTKEERQLLWKNRYVMMSLVFDSAYQ